MTYAPFTVQNPGTLPENIAAPPGVDQARLERRRSFLVGSPDKKGKMPEGAGFESDLKTNVKDDATKAHHDIYAKACSLSVSDRRNVFQFDAKDNSALTKYGNNGFGRGCLLAKKLVDAGAVCVEVDLGGWDNHAQVFNALRGTAAAPGLAVRLDRGMGALGEELVQSGRWKNTVVLWMGEFGRTPRINGNNGRDHWANSWSTVLAGGGIKGGQVIGKTGPDGIEVKDRPVSVPDLLGTVCKSLGLDIAKQNQSNVGRPIRLVDTDAKPIKEVLS